MNELKHIGVIMDGNRRWARSNGAKTVLAGHEKGVYKFSELCTWCIARGIPYLSVYAFSTENWNRSDYEVDGLFSIMQRFFEEKLQDCIDRDIRIAVVGDRDRLKPSYRDIVRMAEEKTRHCGSLLVHIAISYGGRDELARAARKLAEAVRRGELEPEDITEKTLEAHLDTAGVPMIDMVIRTGGNQRLSNFFVWQTAYSEIYFTETLWPDFSEAELDLFIDRYRGVQINMGS